MQGKTVGAWLGNMLIIRRILAKVKGGVISALYALSCLVCPYGGGECQWPVGIDRIVVDTEMGAMHV